MPAVEAFGSVASAEVTILVDSVAGTLARSTDDVKRFASGPLIAEPGFAASIRLSPAGGTVLWDAGASGTAVLENLRRMGTDPTSIDQIALSHGHWDHVAGVSDILRALQRVPEVKTFPRGTTDDELVEHARSEPIPLIVHPAAFRERWRFLKDGRRRGPMNPTNRAEWEALGARIVESIEPRRIASGCWTTGYVPRSSFETEGRAPDSLRYRDGNRFVPDDTDEDQSIVIHVDGKGLVIVSGCAHAGIVNTVLYARELTGVDRVHAIVGGFHLGRSSEEEIRRTVDAIVAADPAVVVPTHCTGFDAMRRFADRMPEAFVLATVGTTFTF